MLKKLFKKKADSKTPRGFHELSIKKITQLTPESAQITLNVPEELKSDFTYTPGQYLDLEISLDGKKHRRSYSICVGPSEDLAFAVKKVEGGTISLWLNKEAQEGQTLLTSTPQGGFVWKPEMKNIVCFAAGSGITPIKSIAQHAIAAGANVNLVFGNRTEKSAMFVPELKNLLGDKLLLTYSQEKVEGCLEGRLSEEMFSAILKEHLEWLKADAFFFCGPGEMIETGMNKLKMFGVNESKMHRELFTTVGMPTQEKETKNEAQNSDVTVVLDGEEISLTYKKNGKGILDLLDSEGYDPPYSCRGGVCSTCKAQIIEGSADMKVNYTLTEQEIEEGAVLCCQAVPTSAKLKLSFDE